MLVYVVFTVQFAQFVFVLMRAMFIKQITQLVYMLMDIVTVERAMRLAYVFTYVIFVEHVITADVTLCFPPQPLDLLEMEECSPVSALATASGQSASEKRIIQDLQLGKSKMWICLMPPALMVRRRDGAASVSFATL